MPNIYNPFTMLENENPGPNDRWVDVEVASFEKLNAIADGTHGPMAFVWPDEGSFNRAGEWGFNDKHPQFQPLMIDKTSASMLIAVYERLSKPENAEKLRRMVVKDRGSFGAVFEIAARAVKISFGTVSVS
ncbi:MAG: hypothetical protein LAT55_13000 [Opitutales bacterium]|nr:hypothetical protein [Opitutales bacterium]